MIKNIENVFSRKFCYVEGFDENGKCYRKCPVTGKFVPLSNDPTIAWGISREGLEQLIDDEPEMAESFGEEFGYENEKEFVSLRGFCLEDDMAFCEYLVEKYGKWIFD